MDCIGILVKLVFLFYWSPITRSEGTGKPSPLRLRFDPPANRVRLGAPLIVRCEFDPGKEELSGASMSLYCPIAPWNSFCFQNCKSACAGSLPERCEYERQLGSVSCRSVITQNGHVTYEYTIPRLTDQWLSTDSDGIKNDWGFYCSSAGWETAKVWLTEGPKEVQTYPPSTTTTAPETTLKIRLTPIEPAPSTSLEVKYPESPQQATAIRAQSAFSDVRSSAILRELLVVVAIVIVFLSLSINVFCCIRCALIRQYTKSKRPARMQHLFCMAEEIRNARLVRGGSQSDYWNRKTADSWYVKQLADAQQLGQAIREGSFASDGRLLVSQPQSLVGDSGFYVPSELLINPPNQQTAFSDTNSNTTASADVHTRHPKDGRMISPMTGSAFSITPVANVPMPISERRSKTSSLILVPGPNGLQILQAPVAQNQLAAAVANYCMQQQQRLIDMQNQMNSSDFGMMSINQSSDGQPSCFGSICSPDSGAVEQFQPPSSGISTLRRQSVTREPLLTENNKRQFSGSLNTELTQPMMTIIPGQSHSATSGSPLSTDAFYHIQSTLPHQVMRSSQPQLRSGQATVGQLNEASSNPVLLMQNFSGLQAGTSQSDSGNGSGSGHFSLTGKSAAMMNLAANLDASKQTVGTVPTSPGTTGIVNLQIAGNTMEQVPKNLLNEQVRLT